MLFLLHQIRKLCGFMACSGLFPGFYFLVFNILVNYFFFFSTFFLSKRLSQNDTPSIARGGLSAGQRVFMFPSALLTCSAFWTKVLQKSEWYSPKRLCGLPAPANGL
jgi:hypothetical protein